MKNSRESGKRVKWDKRKVLALRHELGLTQSEMAAQLGVRQQTISEWETGLYSPRGASNTLLNIVADGAGFKYGADSGQTGTSKQLRE